jgi:hypothetical protein
LEFYQTKKNILLADKSLPAGNQHEPVTITWQVSLTMLEKKCPEALNVLQYCAWLHHADIPWRLLIDCLPQNNRDEQELSLAFNEIKRGLKSYSLCTLNTQTQTLSLHQLLQDVIREQLTQQEKASVLTALIKILIMSHNKAKAERDEEKERLLLPQLDTLVGHITSLHNGIISHELIIGLLEATSRTHLYLLQSPLPAKNLLECALAIKEKHYGADHYQVASTLGSLGNAYGALGDAKQQKQLLKRALAIKGKYYGADHWQLADALESLCNVYLLMSKLTKGLAAIQKAYTIRKQYFGDENQRTISTYKLLQACEQKQKTQTSISLLPSTGYFRTTLFMQPVQQEDKIIAESTNYHDSNLILLLSEKQIEQLKLMDKEDEKIELKLNEYESKIQGMLNNLDLQQLQVLETEVGKNKILEEVYLSLKNKFS